MAQETIKIVYEVDNSAIKSATDTLVEQGKVIKEDAEAFKALGIAATAADAGIKKVADDIKVVGDSAKQAGEGAKKINDELGKTGKANVPIKNTGNAFKGLSAQIKEAQREVERLTQQFGKNNVQTIQAKEKLALLRKEFKDLNQEVNTLNPEGKIAAFNNLGTSISGVFQVATGALQAFGVESESIQKVATQFQGVINIVQGFGSLSQVGDAVKNVGTALGVVSSSTEVINKGLQGTIAVAGEATESATDLADGISQVAGTAADTAGFLSTYKKAQQASTTATQGATAAQIAFNNALKANPAFFAAAAIGAVVGAFLLYNNLKDDNVQKTEEQLELEKENIAANDDLLKGIEDQITKQRILNDESLGYYSDQTAALKKNEREREEFTANYINEINKLNDKQKAAGLEEIYFVNPVTLGRIGKLFNLRQEQINQLFALKNAEIELNNVKKEQAKLIEDLTSKLDEEKKRRADAIALLREQGEPLDVILKKQQENNEWEIQALQNIRAKNADLKISEEAQNAINTALERAKQANDAARVSQLEALKESLKGGKAREQIQNRINQLTRDNILLNQQLGNTELEKVTKGVEQRLVAKTRELEVDKLRGRSQVEISTDQLNANKRAVREYELILKTDTDILKNKEKVKEIQEKINELLFQNKKLSSDISDEAQKEQDAALQSSLQFAEDDFNIRDKNITNNIKNEKEADKERKKNELQHLEEMQALYLFYGKKNTALDAEVAKRRKEIKDGEADEEKDRQQEIYESARETLLAAADLAGQLNSNRLAKEQEELEKAREDGIITEEEYQEKLKKIKQKQAKADKEAAIFSATIKFAEALINALTITPSTAAPAALAFAAATAGLNLAKIIATPIPKFNKGTLSVAGVDMGSDSVHAMLRPGEAVIPVETNKAYHPTIKAIYKKQISPSEINAFVLNKLGGKSSIGKDTQISASVDSFALGRVLSKNRSVDVSNAGVVGKVIANELSRKINPRQII